MSMEPRGIHGVQARVQEIQARIAALKGTDKQATPFPFTPASMSRGLPPFEAGPPQSGSSAPPAAMRGALPGALNPALTGPSGFEPLNPLTTIVAPAAQGRAELEQMARATAARHGLDEGLFMALVQQESGWNPRAVSSAGAQGLTQLMPGTARMLGVADPFDPAANLDGGARYLAQMMKEFGGDARLALAAYNAGPGAVRRHKGVPPFAETQNYVKTILGSAGGAR